jgi:hypothetical protein
MKRLFRLILFLGLILLQPLNAGAEPKVRAETAVLIDGQDFFSLPVKNFPGLRQVYPFIISLK